MEPNEAISPNIQDSAAPASGGGIVGVPQLLEFWRIARTNWLIITSLVIAALIAGVIITMSMTPRYTATARVELKREDENTTNISKSENANVLQGLEFYQTQYALLEARSLAERVVRVARLDTDKAFLKAYKLDDEVASDTAAGAGTVKRPVTGQKQKMIAQILLSGVTISPIRGSSLVDVSFNSPDQALSAKIANVWVEQYISAELERRFASSADARKFLEQQLDQYRKKLEDSESQLVGYASQKQIVALNSTKGADGSTVAERTIASADLESLNDALAKVTARRIEAEAAVRQGLSASSATQDQDASSALRQRRAEAQAEYARLMAQFEPGYPKARAVQEQINSLDRAIANERTQLRSSANAEFRSMAQQEAALRAQVGRLKSELISQREDSIQYGIYQREVDTNRELYNSLLQRYKEIGVADVGKSKVAIIDRAEVPGAPSSPNLPINMLISLLAGLGLAALYLVIRENLDQTLRDPAKVRSALHLPLLGTVPDSPSDDVLADLEDAKSEVHEAYLAIRANLSFLTDKGVPQSMLFTSTLPNEGKSSSSYAVARALSDNGKKVLLIDCDMRNPSLHGILGIKRNRGLSNYLSGDGDWKTMIERSDKVPFAALTAGPIPPNAGQLLLSDRMKHLIEELTQHFDHVVLDCPPVLGLADVPLLSNCVQGVVYVTEANRPRIRAIQSALGRIRAANGHIFGVIVTRLDHRNEAYAYGDRYGYGYGYGGSAS